MSLFLAICWGAQFTGGHFNPAITFAMMLKK
jgi:glycerol uptake facilitator-like aquaporin